MSIERYFGIAGMRDLQSERKFARWSERLEEAHG